MGPLGSLISPTIRHGGLSCATLACIQGPLARLIPQRGITLTHAMPVPTIVSTVQTAPAKCIGIGVDLGFRRDWLADGTAAPIKHGRPTGR